MTQPSSAFVGVLLAKLGNRCAPLHADSFELIQLNVETHTHVSLNVHSLLISALVWACLLGS